MFLFNNPVPEGTLGAIKASTNGAASTGLLNVPGVPIEVSVIPVKIRTAYAGEPDSQEYAADGRAMQHVIGKSLNSPDLVSRCAEFCAAG